LGPLGPVRGGLSTPDVPTAVALRVLESETYFWVIDQSTLRNGRVAVITSWSFVAACEASRPLVVLTTVTVTPVVLTPALLRYWSTTCWTWAFVNEPLMAWRFPWSVASRRVC